MSTFFKKLFFIILLNSTFFLILIIGIQNSEKKSKVYFLNKESINLPISFITVVSFINGSLTGGILKLNILKK